jgi:hypothetical protein
MTAYRGQKDGRQKTVTFFDVLSLWVTVTKIRLGNLKIWLRILRLKTDNYVSLLTLFHKLLSNGWEFTGAYEEPGVFTMYFTPRKK